MGPQTPQEPEPEPEGEEHAGCRFYAVWHPATGAGPWWGHWGNARRQADPQQGDLWGKKRPSEEACRIWPRAHGHFAAAARPLQLAP